jgi:nicotinamidase-related amidase
MALTKMDEKSALIVIDLQKGIAGMATVHPMKDVIGNAARLAKEFRKRGLPVVLVNVAGMAPGRVEAVRPKLDFPPDWTELVPELEAQKGDHLVTKQRVGAFLGTDLDAYLRGRGVTQVVMSGVATTFGVESTARSAFDLGYNVTFVVDAMSDRDAEAHRNSVEKIFPRMGETGTTEEVIGMLDRRM